MVPSNVLYPKLMSFLANDQLEKFLFQDWLGLGSSTKHDRTMTTVAMEKMITHLLGERHFFRMGELGNEKRRSSKTRISEARCSFTVTDQRA